MSRLLPTRLEASLTIAIIAALILIACGPQTDPGPSAADAALEARVAAAIANAADLPADAFSVAASDGVVTIRGSVGCEDCGALKTAPGIQSIQQTLGAVARAVPGVERVEFELEY